MSEVEMKQQLDNVNNMLRVANAKLQASNHSIGVSIAENNDVKAANILYQEREKELMSKVQELQFKITALEGELLQAHRKIEDLQNELDALKHPQTQDQSQPLGE